MSRLLLAVALVLIILWALQRGAEARRKRAAHRTDPPAKDQSPAIVPCAYCGVHLPKAEAIESDGRTYCSPAHVSLARHDEH
jgi:uncharacterized protein